MKLALLGLFICSRGLMAQTGPTTYGHVTDTAGRAISNVKITVHCGDEKPYLADGDRNGAYNLYFDGTCTVAFAAPGYISFSVPKKHYERCSEIQFDVQMELFPKDDK